MKTQATLLQYNDLRIRMELKFSNSKTTWSNYYAALLDFGGNTPSQQLRNIFFDDTKEFTDYQLTLIYQDLENTSHLDSFTQDEVKEEVFNFISKLGNLSETIKNHFDDNNEIDLDEVNKLLPHFKQINSLSHDLLFRALETKRQSLF